MACMQHLILPSIFFLLFTVPAVDSFGQAAPAAPPARTPMTMSISGWADGTPIPLRFSAASPNPVSPEIAWTNVPDGTRSFVLHMHDIEVARDKTTNDQVHWLVWNIPANARGLPENVPAGSPRPDGSFQISATGPVYRPPGAPAVGPLHHYVFELYALDVPLENVQPGTNEQTTRTSVLAAIQGHILGKAVYVGLFRRPQ